MAINKVDISFENAYRFLHPRNTVLVSCTDKTGKANIITLAWSMPTSHNPVLVAISVSPKRYSHHMIEETGEFVLNVPTMKIVKQTLFCGRVSGIDRDKFREAPLTALPAKKVKAPIIEECVAHLECKVVKSIVTGDHTLFIGEVVGAYANKGVFGKEFHIKRVKPIFHLGYDDFVTLSPEVTTPNIRKKVK